KRGRLCARLGVEAVDCGRGGKTGHALVIIRVRGRKGRVGRVVRHRQLLGQRRLRLEPVVHAAPTPDPADGHRSDLLTARACGRFLNAASTGRYGNSATWVSPKVSGKPSIRFMFCTAWPDAPFTRLSRAAMTMARPGRRSAATPIKVMLEPRTCRV